LTAAAPCQTPRTPSYPAGATVPSVNSTVLQGAPALRAWESRTSPEAQSADRLVGVRSRNRCSPRATAARVATQARELLHAPDMHAVGQRPAWYPPTSAEHTSVHARTRRSPTLARVLDPSRVNNMKGTSPGRCGRVHGCDSAVAVRRGRRNGDRESLCRYDQLKDTPLARLQEWASRSRGQSTRRPDAAASFCTSTRPSRRRAVTDEPDTHMRRGLLRDHTAVRTRRLVHCRTSRDRRQMPNRPQAPVHTPPRVHKPKASRKVAPGCRARRGVEKRPICR